MSDLDALVLCSGRSLCKVTINELGGLLHCFLFFRKGNVAARKALNNGSTEPL